MKRFYKKSAGFSLVELMIVVAIMAILAAIAIPSFIRFQMRAKSSESSNNLGAVRTCEVSYEAENDAYIACAAAPAAAPNGDNRMPWLPAGGGEIAFENIGFEPEGPVRYRYVVLSDGSYFMAVAVGDLDNDGGDCVYSMDNRSANYPKIEINVATAGERTAAGASETADGF